jgi:aminomethyltransferase
MGKRVNMEIKKTSLYQLHQDNKAKFVEFAGYQMPIQYSEGIVEEHKFTRIILVFLMFLIWVNYLFMVMKI